MKIATNATILFIFLIVLLTSCNDLISPPKTKPTNVMETALAEARTSFVETQRAVSTITATSTPTPSPTPNLATSMSYPTNWMPIFATLESRSVKCSEGYSLEVPEVIDRNSDERWSIFTCSPQPEDYKTIWTPGAVDYGKRYTEILKTDLSKSWVIFHNDFPWSNRPNAFLWTYAWDRDGNYVYVIPMTSPSASGGSAAGKFRNSDELYRVSLNSGEFEIVLPSMKGGYSYSLSPDGKYLAYSILKEKNIIRIRNLENNEEKHLKLKDDYILSGAFAWKPDSTTLIFASAINGWEEGTAGISIFTLTLKDMHTQIILLNDKRLLIPFPQFKEWEPYYWSDKNFLTVRSLKNETVEYFSDLALDIQSGGVIILATPNSRLIDSLTAKP